MSRKKVFISYQRGHVDEITRLVTALEKTGKYEVWYDQKIESGKWWELIMSNLQKADVVVLAVSRTYLNSVACKLEREYARLLNKAILPVTVDEALNYNDLPHEIGELQVKKYFGQVEQFLDLMTALDKEQSPPLPNPIPEPPPAPMPPKPDPVSVAVAAPPAAGKSAYRYWIGGGVGLIALVLIALALTNFSSPPVSVPTQTVAKPTDTSKPVTQPGAFDINLIYGGMDSFAVHVNAPSNLTDVMLTTSSGASENLIERFPDLALYSGAVPQGVCLLYEREGSKPTLPLDCDGGLVQRRELSPSNVFWFNDSSNLYNNIILRRGEFKQLCPHSNGGGKCDVKAE